MDKKAVMVDVAKADWADIRRQKRMLFRVVRRNGPEREAFEGLLSFLDDIQDQAAAILGNKAVFGKDRD